MAGIETIADGVWLIRGDLRKAMNIYFVADGERKVMFDAATRAMTRQTRKAIAELGGVDRIVLGHSHPDHRATASRLGLPILCHPDEVAYAESSRAIPEYFDISSIPYRYPRVLYPLALRIWDGGPAEIADTVTEGDRIGEFEVVHFPGHAPGLIGLWRERDRLAIVSDTVYLTDTYRPLGHHPGLYVPNPAWNWSSDKARDSVRKLAALEPATICTGHLDPLEGDSAELRRRLEAAADSPGW